MHLSNLIRLCLLSWIMSCHFVIFLYSQTYSLTYNHTLYFEVEGGDNSNNNSYAQPMRLDIDGNKSLYTMDKSNVENVDEGRNRWVRRMRSQSFKDIYKDRMSALQIEGRNLFGKKFIVEDTLRDYKWKISAGEQRSIEGYTCMKATYKDSTENIIAYFTTQIPSKHGPDIYGGLPGMILEVQSAKFHIVATKIDTAITSVSIEKPNDGDRVSKEKYDKIREEKLKEREEMWGGHGNNRVRIIRN